MTATDLRRIAILEDDPAIRDHFIEIIGSADDLELCATASMIGEVPLLIERRPDLLLTDIGLPDGSGLDVLPAVKAATGCRALVITAFGDRDTVVAAMKAGADGYLLKDSPAAVILDGIRVTLEGGAPISPAAAVYLLERLRAAPTPSRRDDPSEPLTMREDGASDHLCTGTELQGGGAHPGHIAPDGRQSRQVDLPQARSQFARRGRL